MSNTGWDFLNIQFFVHSVVNYKVYSSQFCNKNKSIITNRSMFVQK